MEMTSTTTLSTLSVQIPGESFKINLYYLFINKLELKL